MHVGSDRVKATVKGQKKDKICYMISPSQFGRFTTGINALNISDYFRFSRCAKTPKKSHSFQNRDSFEVHDRL